MSENHAEPVREGPVRASEDHFLIQDYLFCFHLDVMLVKCDGLAALKAEALFFNTVQAVAVRASSPHQWSSHLFWYNREWKQLILHSPLDALEEPHGWQLGVDYDGAFYCEVDKCALRTSSRPHAHFVVKFKQAGRVSLQKRRKEMCGKAAVVRKY